MFFSQIVTLLKMFVMYSGIDSVSIPVSRARLLGQHVIRMAAGFCNFFNFQGKKRRFVCMGGVILVLI